MFFRIMLAVFMVLTLHAPVAEAAVASFYANRFHGRVTASGLPFNAGDQRMAAHKGYKLGTLVRVTRPGRSPVTVTIVDRGPYVPGRHIDLSPAAADALGFRRAGTAPVTLTKVGFDPHYKQHLDW